MLYGYLFTGAQCITFYFLVKNGYTQIGKMNSKTGYICRKRSLCQLFKRVLIQWFLDHCIKRVYFKAPVFFNKKILHLISVATCAHHANKLPGGYNGYIFAVEY